MATYRAYGIGPDGVFVRAHNFSASDDNAAKDHAARYTNGHDVELWHGDNKIAVLPRKAENR